MKILLLGYGKMGKAIECIALQRHHQIVEKITLQNYTSFDRLDASMVDVAIEFSQSSAAYNNIYQCIKKGIPVVSGTTGWLEDKEKIVQYCKKVNGTFLYAANFSIGAHLFFQLNTQLANIMKNYSVYHPKVTEIHHTEKKDTPSGTAITLANTIIDELPQKKSWINQQTNQNDVLSVLSKREQGVIGTHYVTYASAIDTIQIQHTAHSRQGFALGALCVAEWIQHKKGVFTIEDFLYTKK